MIFFRIIFFLILSIFLMIGDANADPVKSKVLNKANEKFQLLGFESTPEYQNFAKAHIPMDESDKKELLIEGDDLFFGDVEVRIVFIASSAFCGNHGCAFYIFEKNKDAEDFKEIRFYSLPGGLPIFMRRCDDDLELAVASPKAFSKYNVISIANKYPMIVVETSNLANYSCSHNIKYPGLHPG